MNCHFLPLTCDPTCHPLLFLFYFLSTLISGRLAQQKCRAAGRAAVGRDARRGTTRTRAEDGGARSDGARWGGQVRRGCLLKLHPTELPARAPFGGEIGAMRSGQVPTGRAGSGEAGSGEVGRAGGLRQGCLVELSPVEIHGAGRTSGASGVRRSGGASGRGRSADSRGPGAERRRLDSPHGFAMLYRAT